VWDHVIRALRIGPEKPMEMTKTRSPRDPQSASCNAQIKVLERLTDRTITILWQDATRCRYVDQIWTRCRARASGRCAMTGAAIGRDDIVFKPRSRSAFPGNARAMILATVIDSMPVLNAEAQAMAC
jgi:hypothetical protein